MILAEEVKENMGKVVVEKEVGVKDVVSQRNGFLAEICTTSYHIIVVASYLY